MRDQRASPATSFRVRRRVLNGVIGIDRAERAALKFDKPLSARVSRLSADGRRSAQVLNGLRNEFVGKRCVIIGNGPSLNKTDLSLLADETTFGLNRLYLMRGRLNFDCNFHVVVNRLVVEQCADELLGVRGQLFSTWPNRDLFHGSHKPAYLHRLERPTFSENARFGVWEGATVTFVALQLAFYFGFEQVVLVGVDHNFVSQGAPHSTVVSSGADRDHFDPRYFGKGFRWQLPDLEGSENSYRLAERAFRSHGRQVIDCTVGGRLTVFPKCSLLEALS